LHFFRAVHFTDEFLLVGIQIVKNVLNDGRTTLRKQAELVAEVSDLALIILRDLEDVKRDIKVKHHFFFVFVAELLAK
jgi:hypothetical protein